MRLTRDVREQLLALNEGFSMTTNYVGRNFKEDRTYTIDGGRLLVRSTSKTSWADSRRHDEFVADDEQTHRFLYTYLSRLATDGVVQGRRLARAAAPDARPVNSDTKVDDESADDSDGDGPAWLLHTAVVIGVVGVIYVVGKPVWQQRVKPALARKAAERRQRKLEAERQREVERASEEDEP